MGDLWQDERIGDAGAGEDADDDWDEGGESDTSREDGFDDPEELSDDDGWGEGDD
jgi:hypothetical protein